MPIICSRLYIHFMTCGILLQYLGGQTPEAVQTRVKKLLYSWKLGLPNETKIQEAYEMLKKEGKCTYSLHVRAELLIVTYPLRVLLCESEINGCII